MDSRLLTRILAGTVALVGSGLLAATPAFSQEPAAPAARVGIVMPKAQLGQGNAGQDVAGPVRQLIMSYMAGPVLELVQLDARIPAQIHAEAQAKGCTHLLYTTVEQKKGKKGIGGLFGAVAPAAGILTGMSAGGDMGGAMIMGAASQAAAQAAQQQAMDSLMQAQAGTVRAKDEISLNYQLLTVAGTSAPLEATLKAKAEQDGQDLLSPLVEQLATTAVEAVLTP